MIVGHFRLEVNEANAFILGCEQTGEACLIDAGDCDPRFKPFLEAHGLTLRKILITHDHWDHTDGLGDVLKTFGPTPVFSFSGSIAGVTTEKLAHGDSFSIGALNGRMVATPGHTPDGISWILPGVVFSGDALFNGAVGGTASPELYAQQHDGIKKHLLSLPDDYEVYSGHGPATTIGLEKRFNPFFT